MQRLDREHILYKALFGSGEFSGLPRQQLIEGARRLEAAGIDQVIGVSMGPPMYPTSGGGAEFALLIQYEGAWHLATLSESQTARHHLAPPAPLVGIRHLKGFAPETTARELKALATALHDVLRSDDYRLGEIQPVTAETRYHDLLYCQRGVSPERTRPMSVAAVA
jgi:hypothetical protein